MFPLRVAVVFALLGATSLGAQPSISSGPSTSVPNQAFSLISRSTGGLAVIAGGSFVPLPMPITVPNWLKGATDFGNTLRQLDTVPSRDGRLPPPGTPTLLELAKRVSETVELSARTPGAGERAELEAARRFLFAGGSNTPSPVYARYISFKQQYDEAVAAFSQERNEAQRQILRSRISNIERDWELFGRRSEVDSALQTVSRLDDPPHTEGLASWRALIERGTLMPVDSLAGAVASGSWVRLSLSSAEVRLPLSLSVVRRQGGPQDIQLPPPAQLSLEFTVFEIPRPALAHAFLDDRTWRSRDGLLLSDGDPNSDTSAELMPRFVSHLVLIRNLEVTFERDLDDSVGRALQGDESILLSGYPLRSGSGAALVFQPRAIFVGNPAILAIGITNLRRTPNPNPDRQWR